MYFNLLLVIDIVFILLYVALYQEFSFKTCSVQGGKIELKWTYTGIQRALVFCNKYKILHVCEKCEERAWS